MIFDEKNGLNFDFDTPLEEIEVVDISTDEVDAFDLATLASSNEKRNSSIRKNRINEDIIKDKSIEREQEIFDLNRERHAAQNAAVRTAPHAITAEELMKGKKSFRAKQDVDVAEEINLDFKFDAVKDADTDSEKNYSNAAQMLFEKLRNRKGNEIKPDELIGSVDCASVELDEDVEISNEEDVFDIVDVADDVIEQNENSDDLLVLEDVFGSDDTPDNLNIGEILSIDEVDDFTDAEIPVIEFH